MILLFLTAAGSIPLRQRSPYISCPQEPLSAVLQKLQSGDHHVGAPIAALLMNVCLAVGATARLTQVYSMPGVLAREGTLPPLFPCVYM